MNHIAHNAIDAKVTPTSTRPRPKPTCTKMEGATTSPNTESGDASCRDGSVSPDISALDIGVEFAALPEYRETGITRIGFGGLLTPPLQLREDLSSGCGGQTWPAGMLLAKHMLKYHQDNIRNARVYVLLPRQSALPAPFSSPSEGFLQKRLGGYSPL
jgi:hypothetical protein